MSDRGSVVCEVCGMYDSRVFDPCGAHWCKVCDLMGLGELAVRWRLDDMAEGMGRAFDAAVFLDLRVEAGEVVESLALADRAYVYEDVLGAHWGWHRAADSWLAWNTAPYSEGRGAVGPFRRVLRNVVEVRLSNTAGEPATSAFVESGKAEDMQPDVPVGDAVDQPSHYNQGPPCKGCGRPIECLDITEHMNFCLGNTVKYVWRCDLKHDAIEDLRKARKYLDTEIARREAQLVAEFTTRDRSKSA
ncbi:hypothetical protein I5H08_gp047 [Mycobacterium phage Yuna]|uniref:Uncharacterized protein n=1 Tax=Mycobacterium phage Yuna TaxID=2599885 RepID=A0A5J6TF70_9CAUD|nr:hypothetical protein I5H08_gp047 [Mycobacterium phage Yuna]QFG09440.1 hypothetical protein PBI_YUNA_58 [Mycobacterium phage Yuna]